MPRCRCSPVADTLRRNGRRRMDDGAARRAVSRPDAARLSLCRDPRGASRSCGEDVTDDMALAELAGLKIVAVAGEETNMKVTTAEDFAVAGAFAVRAAARRAPASGYDVHRFVAGDHVWLCGVKIPHDHGLEGHSDADAGLHALTDAILGAIGEGDIGQHFPPTDERWRGAPSWKFLDHAAGLVREPRAAHRALRRHADLRAAEDRAAPRRHARTHRRDS